MKIGIIQWFRSVVNTTAHRCSYPLDRLTFRPSVECLEDRITPSTLTLNNFNNNTAASISYDDQAGHRGTDNTQLSQLRVTYTPDAGASATFNTFCIDLFHTISNGETYGVAPRSDLSSAYTNGSRMAYIFATYGLQDLSNNPDQASAVQLALWDLSLNNHTPVSFGVDADGSYSSGDDKVFKASLSGNSHASQIAATTDAYLKASIGVATQGKWFDAANRGQSLINPIIASAASGINYTFGEIGSPRVEGSPSQSDVGKRQFLTSTPATVSGGPATVVRVLNSATGQERFRTVPFPGFQGIVRLATADVNGDGVADVIVAAGPGGGPQVRVYDGSTGQPLSGPLGSFFAMTPSFSGGLCVAAGDVNGDGFADIVVGADAGGGPQVTVFSGRDGHVLSSFHAFSASFSGGVRVGVGDVNGDGFADVIAGAGPGGGPQVAIFSGRDFTAMRSFFAFDPRFTGGVFVSAGDIDGDGLADVITGAGAGGGPQVTSFRGSHGTILSSFFAFDARYTGGVRVGSSDVNGDGRSDFLVAASESPVTQVRILDSTSLAELDNFFAYNATSFPGGVFLSGRTR